MKKTFLRRVIALALAGTLAWSSVPSFALESVPQTETATESSEAGKVSGVWTLDMWHYSGGYWKVGNKGSEQIRIEDRDIVSLDSYLQANQQAVFTVSVTQEIADLSPESTVVRSMMLRSRILRTFARVSRA